MHLFITHNINIQERKLSHILFVRASDGWITDSDVLTFINMTLFTKPFSVLFYYKYANIQCKVVLL